MNGGSGATRGGRTCLSRRRYDDERTHSEGGRTGEDDPHGANQLFES